MSEDVVGLEVKGLREFRAALKRADRDLARDVTRRLRGIAAITAGEARALAASRTEKHTGDLVKGIVPFANARGAGVRSKASHRGYLYPKRLEFEGRRGGETGPRASLYPAYRKSLPLLIAAGEQALADIETDLSR